jgi:SAM-dependent methyltransferase
MAWFADWFDSPHYHALYSHRSDTEAAAFVDSLVRWLEPRPGARAVDLGCGAGRHARRLAAHALDVVGLDLSASSLARAKGLEHRGLTFRRHDMRRRFGRRAFDYVFNLFTSFGYFDSDAEHLQVLRNIAAALRPEGTLILDYLNVSAAETRLQPVQTQAIGQTVYDITRWTDTRHFYKRVAIRESGREPLQFVERVARFTLADFDRMFARAGLRIEQVFGDYALGSFDPARSPRLVLVARPANFRRMRLTVSGVTPRYDATIHCGTRAAMEG